MSFDPKHPLNTKLVAALQARRSAPVALFEPPDASPDAYWDRGCHPDVVEHVWDHLGCDLPAECRLIVIGHPALVEPSRGVAFALAFGTAYVVRIPDDEIDSALSAGCTTTRTWSDGQSTDIESDFGRGWVFGGFVKREVEWTRRVYEQIMAGAG